jgi:rhamnogalacturonyl hydrolase YesR
MVKTMTINSLVVLAAMLMAPAVRAAQEYVIVPGGAADGAEMYTDRTYVYQQVPEAVRGGDLVQMRIEDRFTDPDKPLLELTLSNPATVQVGFDSRGTQAPAWLASWEKTGEVARGAKHLKMELYAKDFPAGKVVLYGCKAQGAQAMYVVFATPGSLADVKKIGEAESAVYDRAADRHQFTVFMNEGGWCWYQDPRAIVCNGKLFMGAVQGNGSGAARVGVYDLENKTPPGSVVMQDHFGRDDHNAPVFYARPDGSVLAVYAMHHAESCFYTRISDPNDPLRWGAETKVEASERVTYANLYEMKDEGKLYSFFRGIRFNPTFMTSTDGGETWGEETRFIASELDGTHRPYGRYAGNGTDTVHISFTDGHPRQFGNSIYYAAFRDGTFWRADGTRIKELAKDGPLRPSEAELVFKGSGEPGGKNDLSAPRSAWTSSMAFDENGYPHIAYTLYISNSDHRYRIASWDGQQWHDREVAFGGTCLYDLESSYTGLITLDPVDPRYVVISTDVLPFSGKGRGSHEIYRAMVGLNDDVTTVRWEPLTWHSPVQNLRPVIVRDGNRRVVLWTRGTFSTYTKYQMDVVGIVESVDKKSPIADPFSKDGILEAMTRAKAFQERGGRLSFSWQTGTLYSGVMACYEAAGQDGFLTAARDWCASGNWACGDKHGSKRPLNADAICSAQTFLDVYAADRDPAQIESINRVFETFYFGQEMIDKSLLGHATWGGETAPFIGRNLWWWCDALYMAPPLLARLGQATGNAQYYELLHRLYWDTVDYLYNPAEQLFFRDKNFFDKKTPSGQPVFWARGNGWVIGGLVRTIDYIPDDDPMRPRYIKLFQELMARIVTLQGEDGLWRASLNEPDWFPMQETSGSSFFCFGLAAGINRGWLDRDTYLPAAEKAWEGLVGCLSPEGKVQWAQPVADRPFATGKENTSSYTQGAFLLAASEIYKLKHPSEKNAGSAARTFCRFVPERADDFDWENDLIAFRAYGPALRNGAENNGIDCWLKRVEYPIIDKWYGQMKEKTYHKDWGEGFDPYHVGSSAGCGGTGIWLAGAREPLETFTKQEVIECTPATSVFRLTYEKEIGGDVYGEEKTVMIEPGRRLFDVRSVFTKNGQVAAGLPVCIGVTTHDGKAETFSNEKQGWIACWETMAGSELGTAAMADPQRIDEIKVVNSSRKDESHIFILMKTDRDGAIDYQAGYGWGKAGEIKSSNDWKNYLNGMNPGRL